MCVHNADARTAQVPLMQAQNPEARRGLMDEVNLVKSNQAALTTCYDAATKAKEEQRCSITVPVRGANEHPDNGPERQRISPPVSICALRRR